MTPQPISFYARALKGALPPEAFNPVPSRLAWLALHVALAAGGIVAVGLHWGGLAGAIAAALVIGHSFAGMAFVGHETLHGAVVREQRLRYAIGWLCFMPFALPPRLWVAWHNRVHHGNTMKVGIDPDAYPTLEQFRASPLTRVADVLSLARGRVLGFMTLLVGFTGQSTQIMWRAGRSDLYLGKREHNLAIVERLLAVAVWVAVGFAVGPFPFLFAFAIPLMIANAVVIGYILTNHSLSPLTEVNDPLLNSLTVTAPAIVEKLHLNFGLHVEHHLFPAMSSYYAPLVRDQLVARWPEKYQSLPVLTALWRLARTPRVYKDPVTLVEPYHGRQYPTLVPGAQLQPAEIAVAENEPGVLESLLSQNVSNTG